jgi:hypothetical protein
MELPCSEEALIHTNAVGALVSIYTYSFCSYKSLGQNGFRRGAITHHFVIKIDGTKARE